MLKAAQIDEAAAARHENRGCPTNAAEAVQRAVDTKLTTLQSSMLRLDRQTRQHASEIEEGRADAAGRLRAIDEEKMELESRVTAVESLLARVEREVAAARGGDD